MASLYGMTAYIYGVPLQTSDATLRSMLNDSMPSDCTVHLSELKQGVAVVRTVGSGMYPMHFVPNSEPYLVCSGFKLHLRILKLWL